MADVHVRPHWLGPLRVESDTMLHLDMLRFVAAAGIVWHHSHEFLVPVAQRSAVGAQMQALTLFVDLFFVISGYTISQIYSARLTDGVSYRRFLKRRVGRLVPLHWLTLALSLAFWVMVARVGAVVANAPDLSAGCVMHAAMLLNGMFACGNGYVLNGVIWSISAEMTLYVLFPLLLTGMRRGWLLPLGILVLLVAMALMVQQDGRWDRLHRIVRAFPSFVFGMGLFHWRGRLPATGWSWPVIGMAVLLAVLMVIGLPQLLVLGMVYALAVLAVAADQRHDASPIVRRCAVLGQLTYGIYMWHSLFILAMLNALGDKYLHLQGGAMLALAVFCYAAILCWSYLSLRLFEMPARRWIDGL